MSACIIIETARPSHPMHTAIRMDKTIVLDEIDLLIGHGFLQTLPDPFPIFRMKERGEGFNLPIESSRQHPC